MDSFRRECGVGSCIYVFCPDLIKPCRIARGNFAKVGRGDLVEGQVRDCGIIESAADFARAGFALD